MQKKCDSIENVLLMKILQFLPKSYETLPKVPNHELVILTKFHQSWTKIDNFLLIAHFLASSHSPAHFCRCLDRRNLGCMFRISIFKAALSKYYYLKKVKDFSSFIASFQMKMYLSKLHRFMISRFFLNRLMFTIVWHVTSLTTSWRATTAPSLPTVKRVPARPSPWRATGPCPN